MIAVLGLSYKPDTPVVEESQGLLIARALADAGHSVLIADPMALASASAVLGDAVEAVSTAEAAIALADLVVIATPAGCFKALRPEDFVAEGRRRIVIDCWRILAPEIAEVADVVLLGRG